MKILIVEHNIYNCMEEHKNYYRTMMQRASDVDFYYFTDEKSVATRFPSNVTPIMISNISPNLFCSETLRNVVTSRDNLEFAVKTFAETLASRVSEMSFDLIEISDRVPVGDYFCSALARHDVHYERLVMALVGRLSETMELAWDSHVSQNLRYVENRQFERANAAYGFSEPYLHEWRKARQKPCFFFDPAPLLSPPSPPISVHDGRPEVCCFGSKGKQHGGDIFFELLRWIRPELYSGYRYLTTESDETLAHLQGYAERRKLAFNHSRVASQNDLAAVFARQPLFVLPTRCEPFHLIALEALLNGCPVAVSDQSDVCAFLDKHYPEIPYTRIRSEKFYDCIADIEQTLTYFDAHKAALHMALHKVAEKRTIDAAHMYRRILSETAEDALDAEPDMPLVLPIQRDNEAAPKTRNTWTALSDKLTAWTRMPETSEKMCHDKVIVLHDLVQQTNMLDLERMLSGIGEDAPLPDKKDFFYGNFFCASLWQGLARLLRICGNDDVAATFELRCMRVLGHDAFGLLPKVCATLENSRYAREAEAVRLLYSPCTKEKRTSDILRYLKNREMQFIGKPEFSYDFVDDARTNPEPKVAVIVSLYNAASQLDQFMTCLASQTLAQQGAVEVILQDSHSPTDDYRIAQKYMRSSRLHIVYARSRARETIQTSWNRGVAMARAPYVTLPGTDEIFYPDGLEKLLAHMESSPSTDWVMGNTMLNEVDAHGILDADLLEYDRTGGLRDLYYQDFRYIRWIGGLYKKDLHERFGYYDANYVINGTYDFALRILPHINVAFIPEVVGAYWNYPSVRAASVIGHLPEIEHYREWFLHRSFGGILYAWGHRSDEDIRAHLVRCLGFRRAVCKHQSTDFEYATYLAWLLRKRNAALPTGLTFGMLNEALRLIRSAALLPQGEISPETMYAMCNGIITRLKEIENTLNKTLKPEIPFQFALYNDFLYERCMAFLVEGFAKPVNVFRM